MSCTPSAIVRITSGVAEKRWSGPFRAGSFVKCFSIATAPIATAVSGPTAPMVWSENPVIRPKRSPIATMALRLMSSNGAG